MYIQVTSHHIGHRFPALFEAGTPFHKNKLSFAPPHFKKRRNHKNGPILFLLLLLVIRRPT